MSRSKIIILRNNTGLGLDFSEMTDMGSESLFPQEPVPVALTMYTHEDEFGTIIYLNNVLKI